MELDVVAHLDAGWSHPAAPPAPPAPPARPDSRSAFDQLIDLHRDHGRSIERCEETIGELRDALGAGAARSAPTPGRKIGLNRNIALHEFRLGRLQWHCRQIEQALKDTASPCHARSAPALGRPDAPDAARRDAIDAARKDANGAARPASRSCGPLRWPAEEAPRSPSPAHPPTGAAGPWQALAGWFGFAPTGGRRVA